MAGETGVMDATTSESRRTGRHAPEGAGCSSTTDRFAPITAVEIFKKTLCFADLKPRGRDVAQDISDVGDVARLMTNFLNLNYGFPNGDRRTVVRLAIAETPVLLQGEQSEGAHEKLRDADF